MRIDRLELLNYGAHRHTVLEPGLARLIVIQGENAIGKTTLASESIGHALFKDDRGTVNGGVRLGATDSAVTIEFTFAGERYRAIRRRTTKGAGKSSADLQQLTGGGWRPVASGDKEVPAAVAELLRMDAKTFRTSVSLAQKDLDRFVAATSRDRKEILAAIVVDPRFGPAAAAANRRVLALEREAEASREQLQRHAVAIAELEPVRAALVAQRELVATIEARLVDRRADVAAVGERIRVLDGELAAAAAVTGEQLRLTAERDQLLAEWDRAEARRNRATEARHIAEAGLTAADDIEAAVAGVDAAQAEVDALVEQEREDRKLAGEITDAAAKLEAIDRPLREAIAAWRQRREDATARIRELEAHAQSGTSACQACGQTIDEAAALEQLQAARQRFRDLGEEPKATLALGFASAALQRLESRRRELGWDAEALIAARDRLSGLERLAARAGHIEADRLAVTRETATIDEAEADLARIRTRGLEVRDRLAEISAQAAATDELRQERAALERQVAEATDAIAVDEGQRRDAEGRVARSEAQLEHQDALIAERDAIAARLADGEISIGRHRKLAAAFGLKGIPARMIESVLPELARHANDVLSSLFPISIEIRAQRASADGKSSIEELDLVVRKNGSGELELARISGGQETAVSRALAIGLSRLNARRAGTAIRTLVVDEPDGLDTVRLRALGEALRILAHQGELERVFVISHTTELAEYADLVAELREGPDGPELFIDGIRSQPDEQAAAAA